MDKGRDIHLLTIKSIVGPSCMPKYENWSTALNGEASGSEFSFFPPLSSRIEDKIINCVSWNAAELGD